MSTCACCGALDGALEGTEEQYVPCGDIKSSDLVVADVMLSIEHSSNMRERRILQWTIIMIVSRSLCWEDRKLSSIGA